MSSRVRKAANIGLVLLGVAIGVISNIPAYVKGIGIIPALFLLFLLIAGLYLFSLPVPILGRLILKSESRTLFETTKLEDGIETFRKDMLDILVKKHSSQTNREHRDLRAEIEAAYLEAKVKYEIGEVVVSIFGGAIAILIGHFGIWPSVAEILSVYVLVVTVSIVIRIVILDWLAYDKQDAQMQNRDRLELMLGWNRAILNSSWSQLAILFVGVLSLISPSGYEFAKRILEDFDPKV